MTKQQAIQILDQAVGQMKLSRQDHATLVAALQFLQEYGEEQPKGSTAYVDISKT